MESPSVDQGALGPVILLNAALIVIGPDLLIIGLVLVAAGKDRPQLAKIGAIVALAGIVWLVASAFMIGS